MTVNETFARYSPESKLLQKAISGGSSAVESVIEQLASPYPGVKEKILQAIHDENDNKLWFHLLNCLAFGKWAEDVPLDIATDPAATQRLDISIVDTFSEDCQESEKKGKDQVLQSALNSGNISLRNTAAYLAGLRGDEQAIPFLAEMLERGSKRWQLRAIRAISAIQSPKSASLLVRVLIDDHDIYHQEARQGLSRLGYLAEFAWQEALGHADPHIRWHAARGLAEIGNLGGLPVIAEALSNENPTVRWVSSDLLAHIGIKAVPQILDVIVRKPFTDECRQSAHHALLSIKTYRAQECLKPLISALSSSSTKQIAQIIAERMINDWHRLEMYISGRLQSIDSVN
jgi:HEAT repeat protein